MKHTPGPWQLWTSNSWRRIVSRDHGSVCEPVVQRDGHPDLFFKNGGAEGPDALLIQAAPDLLAALERMVRAHEDMAAAGFGVTEDADHARAAIAKARGQPR